MQIQEKIQMEKLKDKIQLGINEFQQNTLFVANYLKCNLATRAKLSSLITDEGILEGTNLFVIIRYEIEDDTCHIGMGDGPTYSIVLI